MWAGVEAGQLGKIQFGTGIAKNKARKSKGRKEVQPEKAHKSMDPILREMTKRPCWVCCLREIVRPLTAETTQRRASA
ncbi:hypothetical protein L596_004320 [Steinernema carpocapsae]|uniref:Uncharacterized protein n=1 Tax=Steinernema carpocapsae TaxID=34508 RepID=A0A4U8UZJ7_STECR|nr:hypothetical protein L596_004320 [Steinernema carpocapsae]